VAAVSKPCASAAAEAPAAAAVAAAGPPAAATQQQQLGPGGPPVIVSLQPIAPGQQLTLLEQREDGRLVLPALTSFKSGC
jgi:hypothetical protein